MGPGELRETAAGAAETGGRIVRAGTDRRSEEWLISGDILAGSPAVHAALRDIAAGSLP